MHAVKNILFDLDGTIGNTLPLCILAFREAIEPLSGRILSDEEIVATFGPSEEGTIATLLPGKEEQGLDDYLAHYTALHHRWPEPFDGILDLLHDLKKKQVFLGLVTGKGPKSTDITLTHYHLNGFFDTVKTGASSGPVKDQRIEETLAEFSLNRDETLYVGDAPSDITACRDCGIQIAAAAWAPTADLDALTAMKPDFLFTSVFDFSEFLRQQL